MPILNDPNIALVLLFAGILGIYAEFCQPGRIWAGAAGSAAFLLAGVFLSRRPLSLWALVSMGTAVGCCLLEARLQSRGWLTALASLLMVGGCRFLVRSMPPEQDVHLWTALLVATPFCIVSSYLFSAAYRARRNKKRTFDL